MSTLVKATSHTDTKPNYAVTDPPVPAVADTEFGIFVGTGVQSNVEAWNGLNTCSEALREAGWPNPTIGTVSYATYDTLLHRLLVGNGVPPPLPPPVVAVLQGMDFTVAGRSNDTHVQRMAEVYLERVVTPWPWPA